MFFNNMELSQINLETVLIVVIGLITLNLLFIGFYILSVLRELKRTLNRARGMMEEVDRSVKTGMDKFIAIERPLEALSTTTNALAGFLKGADAIKKATQSIVNSGVTASDSIPSKKIEATVVVQDEDGEDLDINNEQNIEPEKKSKKKPKFFK